MNFEKVLFAFFILLALTLNFGFFLGDLGNPEQHHPYELFAALVVSVIATFLKFGDRTPVGSVLLASSLVADLRSYQDLSALLPRGSTLYNMEIESLSSARQTNPPKVGLRGACKRDGNVRA